MHRSNLQVIAPRNARQNGQLPGRSHPTGLAVGCARSGQRHAAPAGKASRFQFFVPAPGFRTHHLILDDLDGHTDFGKISFDVPIAESRTQPNLIPAPKRIVHSSAVVPHQTLS